MDLQLTPLLCLGTALLNLPFGYYRAGVRKFSIQWLLAVHLPVPLIFIIRITSGAGWTIIPLLIASALAGQLVGGMIRPGFGSTRQRKKYP
ncbi:MAG: hypothetical protein AABZ63_05375 [Actinomycetota bacterium]